MKKKINRNCSWKISDDKSTNKNFKITVLKMLKNYRKKSYGKNQKINCEKNENINKEKYKNE